MSRGGGSRVRSERGQTVGRGATAWGLCLENYPRTNEKICTSGAKFSEQECEGLGPGLPGFTSHLQCCRDRSNGRPPDLGKMTKKTAKSSKSSGQKNVKEIRRQPRQKLSIPSFPPTPPKVFCRSAHCIFPLTQIQPSLPRPLCPTRPPESKTHFLTRMHRRCDTGSGGCCVADVNP